MLGGVPIELCAGGVRPAVPVLPTGLVMTVVTPDESLGETMTAVLLAPGGVKACPGTVVVIELAGAEMVGGLTTTGAALTTGADPSGSTQFTFRFEQKSGIDVRSVEVSAPDAAPANVIRAPAIVAAASLA